MVGDQHHTAASYLDNDICGRYLTEVPRTIEEFFFRSKERKKSWPAQRKYSSEQKGDANKKDRGPPP